MVLGNLLGKCLFSADNRSLAKQGKHFFFQIKESQKRGLVVFPFNCFFKQSLDVYVQILTF
jgi:hypothetical protein